MTRKKRRGPTLEEKVERPWCYYCERDFDDMMILLSHQKAKHFRCDKCNRRLNTAGGLSVHMNQVHKEPLEKVDNALESRKDPNIEIFGTEGIPDQAQIDHRIRVTEQFYQDAADRQALTGNIQPGSNDKPAPKRPKLLEEGDLKGRLQKHLEVKTSAVSADYPMQDVSMPNGFQQPYANGANTFQQAPPGQAPYGHSSENPSTPQGAGVAQPPGVRQASRSQAASAAPGYAPGLASQIAQPQPDHAMPDAPQGAGEDTGRRVKKEKGIKMIYVDNEISQEEKMAQMSKYVFQAAAR